MTNTAPRPRPEVAAIQRLRRRLAITVVVVLGVVLGLASIVIVLQQRSQLLSSVDDILDTRADDVEAIIAREVPHGFAGTNVEDHVAQLVSADGEVITSTPNIQGDGPIADGPPSGQAITNRRDLPIEDDHFRLLSRRLADGRVLHVAENIDDVDDSVRVLTISLLVGVPLIVGLLAALALALIEHTLRPVTIAAARQRQFVGDASHELRSPLARLRSRLEVDLAHPAGVQFDDTAREALAETVRMQGLVDDLLVLARSEDDHAVHDRRPVDLDDVVFGVVRGLADRPVEIDLSGVSGAAVSGDEAQLARLVHNLLDNATRYARHLVWVTLDETPNRVRLVVADDGPGIGPSQREAVFERFTQLDEARTPGRAGSGLGLAIAREIAGRHDGTLKASEAPGGGASLTFTMPPLAR